MAKGLIVSALRFEHVCPTVNSTDEAAAHHFRRSRPGSGRSDDSRGPCPGRQGDVADRRWLVCASDRVGVPIANVLDQRLLQEREIARGWSVPEDGWCAPHAPGLAAPSLSDPGGAPAVSFNTRFEERLNGGPARGTNISARLHSKRCPRKSDPISAHGSASFSPGTRRCWEGLIRVRSWSQENRSASQKRRQPWLTFSISLIPAWGSPPATSLDCSSRAGRKNSPHKARYRRARSRRRR